MKKKTLIILVAAALAVLETSCEEQEIVSSVNYDPATFEVEIVFADGFGVIAGECSRYITFFIGDTETVIPIHGAASSLQELWTGHYLDGEFVPPESGDRCDQMECISLAGLVESYSLVTYKYLGERSLTAEQKVEYAHWYSETPLDSIPESVSEYMSVPVKGTVKVEVKYWSVEACFDEGKKDAFLIYETEFLAE